MIGKKKFVPVTLDSADEIFVVHVASLVISNINKVFLFYIAPVTSLKDTEALTITPPEYSDFTDIFSSKLVVEILEYMGINNYAINLNNGKQPLYVPIYSLGPIELDIFKSNIKMNLGNGFIKLSKFFADALIFLFGSLMAVFAYVLITMVLTIGPLRIDTYFLLLASFLIS